MKTFLDVCRGLTRPVVTVSFAWVLCAAIMRIVWTAKIPSLPLEVWIILLSSFTATMTAVIAYWFGSRNNRAPGA